MKSNPSYVLIYFFFTFHGQFLVLHLSLQFQTVQKFVGFFFLEIHDSVKHLIDGVQNVHVEGTFVVISLNLGPFLCLGVEKVLTCIIKS